MYRTSGDVISLLLIRQKKLPFTLKKESFRPKKRIISKILMISSPVALQDLLVGISFLVMKRKTLFKR